MRKAKPALCAVAAIILTCAALFRASAQVDVAATELETVLTGLNSPVYLTSARDGTNRLFILEQPGRILVVQPNTASPAVFLDITSRVASGGERGLLGLAFHPDFESNRRFFVDYTRQGDGATVIAEYRASAANPNVAETAEKPLLTIAQPFANHNGGMIEFGPDGFLYIGMGDGGSANDPGNRAQNTGELLGKILRIDVDHADGSTPYTSPSDNPFFGATAGRDEIYATGLRNPWRFSFDRATGALYVGDVGQNVREEVDIVTRGGNYGWRVFEGSRCTNIDAAMCGSLRATAPIAEYDHTNGRCSITGGYVYRGAKSSLPVGAYVYGDYCTGEIWMLNNGAESLLFDTRLSISSFGEDEAGEIYVVGIGGTIQRIVNPNAPAPAPLRINSAGIYRRSSGSPLDPITVKSNAKKYNVVLSGTGYVTGSVILVNGRALSAELRPNNVEGVNLVARLKRDMLAVPGPLTVEFVNPDGSHSNQITLEVLAASGQ